MDTFYPFIHEPERKKKELEPIPLYVELEPMPQKKKGPRKRKFQE